MNIILIIVPVMLIIYLGFRFRSLPLFVRGSKQYSSGDKEKGMELLVKAVEAGLAEKHQLSVGYVLLREGRLDEAERIFNFLTHNHGTRFNAQHARSYNALIHWKKGDLDTAVKELETLHEENYKSTAFYGNLGFFLIEKGDLDKALEMNLEAMDYNADSPVILDNMGLCRIRRGEWTEAKELYDRLLEDKPAFPDAWYNAALVALNDNDTSRARDLLNTALEKNFSFISTLSREDVEEKLSALDK